MNIIETKAIPVVRKFMSRISISRFNFKKTCKKIERKVLGSDLETYGIKIQGVRVTSITFKR